MCANQLPVSTTFFHRLVVLLLSLPAHLFLFTTSDTKKFESFVNFALNTCL